MNIVIPRPAPYFGDLVITSGVSHWLDNFPEADKGKALKFVFDSVGRFNRADWGEMRYHEDIVSNNEALTECDGGRILASYDIPAELSSAASDDRLWIICDGVGHQAKGRDYCYTTILWPSEY